MQQADPNLMSRSNKNDEYPVGAQTLLGVYISLIKAGKRQFVSLTEEQIS